MSKRMSQAALSVAANSTSANVLAGQLDEFLAGPAAISLAAAASAAGMRATLSVGGRLVIDDQAISGANRFPILPDDLVAAGVAGVPGERLILRFRNTTAGALTVDWAVDVEYLA